MMGQLQPTTDHKEIRPWLGWDWMRLSNWFRPNAIAVSSGAPIRRQKSRSQTPRCHLPNSPSVRANGSTDSRYSVRYSGSAPPPISCRQSAGSTSAWQPVWEAQPAWKSPRPTHRSAPVPARRSTCLCPRLRWEFPHVSSSLRPSASLRFRSCLNH